MTVVAVVIGLLLAALGGLGVASPDRLLALIRSVQTPGGLYSAAGLRLLLGVALLMAGPTSKSPEVVRIFGILALIAAVLTPLIGLERFGTLVDWWWGQGTTVIRVWAMLPLALGLYLAWAVLP
jgi:hypothetical protein